MAHPYIVTIYHSEGWSLVAEKVACKGLDTIDKDNLPTVKDCAEACVGSTMFIFGTNDYDGNQCNEGCRCFCYIGANTDGTCTQYSHDGFRLYRIEKEEKGKILPLKLTRDS